MENWAFTFTIFSSFHFIYLFCFIVMYVGNFLDRWLSSSPYHATLHLPWLRLKTHVHYRTFFKDAMILFCLCHFFFPFLRGPFRPRLSFCHFLFLLSLRIVTFVVYFCHIVTYVSRCHIRGVYFLFSCRLTGGLHRLFANSKEKGRFCLIYHV